MQTTEEKTITRGKAIKIAGAQYNTALVWLQKGTVPGFDRDSFDVPATLALRLANLMSGKQIHPKLIKAVCHRVAAMTTAEIEGHLALDQRYIVVELVSGRVFIARHDAVFATCGKPVQFLVLDLAAAVEHVRRGIEQFAAQKSREN